MSIEPSTPLIAEVEVSLARADKVIERMLGHLAEHEFAVMPKDKGGIVRFHTGEAEVQHHPRGILIRAVAAHEAGLAYMKGVLASQLIALTPGARPQIAWTGHGSDAKAFPNFREMTVTRVADVAPHMRRITLLGTDLDDFAAGGLHFKLFVPPEGVTEPEWPVPGKDGLPVWPAAAKRPSVRTYTIRRIDAGAGTFDVDFVLHGDHGVSHGVGSSWAMRARPGDRVGARGPVGRTLAEADWYLFAGDETALPAISRHLESLPASARGVALLEVADEKERTPIEHRSGVDICWLYRNGAEPGTTTLLFDAVREVEMPPAGISVHAFAGVEAEAFKAIRHHWREVLQLDKKDVLVNTYWRRGVAESE